ncbi:MAG: DUF523 and DUF1722 domain-containing protein [Myxococcota bacterium]
MTSASDSSASTVPRIRVGISACLLGHQVRFDGSHKRDRFLNDSLGRYVEWVSLCPELGAGMSVPRPTLRLVAAPGAKDGVNGSSDEPGPLPRLVTGKGGEDWTDAVSRYANKACDGLQQLDLSGFVLKSRSPSCGMERVKVYSGKSSANKTGVGVFARVLMARFPLLPVEEDGRLCDPVLRDAFLDAVFAYARWQEASRGDMRAAQLVAFHSRNKYQLRAHNPACSAELGRLVARAGQRTSDDVRQRYSALFMTAMKTRATRARHAETLRSMSGHLKRRVSDRARHVLHESIDDYRAGFAPRSVPLTLLRSHALEHELHYLSEQSYLNPFPKSLFQASL